MQQHRQSEKICDMTFNHDKLNNKMNKYKNINNIDSLTCCMLRKNMQHFRASISDDRGTTKFFFSKFFWRVTRC